MMGCLVKCRTVVNFERVGIQCGYFPLVSVVDMRYLNTMALDIRLPGVAQHLCAWTRERLDVQTSLKILTLKIGIEVQSNISDHFALDLSCLSHNIILLL